MIQRPRRFGPRSCTLAELTEEELLEEVNARRGRRRGGPSATATAMRGSPMPRQVRQWLANLELDESATLSDVEVAFTRLKHTYEPATRDPDDKRRAAARLLLNALRSAYNGLRLHLA